MNDSPVDCQNREWTEPQRDKGDRRTAVDEVERIPKTLLTPSCGWLHLISHGYRRASFPSRGSLRLIHTFT